MTSRDTNNARAGGGWIGILLLLEATRRAVGLPMTILAILFLAYIMLGKFLLRFQRRIEDEVVLDAERPMLEEDAGTVIRSVGDLQKYLEAEKQKQQPYYADEPLIPG